MKITTKIKLAHVHNICDELDKSTEFMFQLMQDSVEVELETVLNYMQQDDKEIEKQRKLAMDLLEFFLQFITED